MNSGMPPIIYRGGLLLPHIHYTVRPAKGNCHKPISNVSELHKCTQPTIYDERPCCCQGGTRFTSTHGHCFGAGPIHARNTYGHNRDTKQMPRAACINHAELAKTSEHWIQFRVSPVIGPTILASSRVRTPSLRTPISPLGGGRGLTMH